MNSFPAQTSQPHPQQEPVSMSMTLLFVFIYAIFILIVTGIVFALWNGVMPEICTVCRKMPNMLYALGLIVLVMILFPQGSR